jgi:hypothetical protein
VVGPLLLAGWRPAAAATPPPALPEVRTVTAPLDLPAVDAAIIPADRGAPDRILVVRPRQGGSPASLELLASQGPDWTVVDRLEVAGSLEASSDPWLVGLAPDRFVVVLGGGVAPSTFQLVDIDGRRLLRGATAAIAGPIDGATIADLDEDGVADLVVAGRVIRSGPPGDACSTEISVLAGSSLESLGRFAMGSVRIAGAAVVDLAGTSGPVLVAPVGVRCDTDPADPAQAGDLLVVGLADGRRIRRISLQPADDRPSAPIAADVGGRPIVITVDGERTVIVDPASDQPATGILTGPVRPVAIGPSTGGVAPIVLAQLVDGEPDAIRVGGLVRDASGAVDYVDNGFRRNQAEIARWAATIPRHGTGVRWPVGGSIEIPGVSCPVVLAPTVVDRCATQPGGSLAVGPAWVGSRPLGVLPGPDGPRLIAASSLTWVPQGLGLASPSPWAFAVASDRWRVGPSVPFALAQLPADRLLAGDPFDQADASLTPATEPGPAGIVATARTGARVLVRPAGSTGSAAEASPPALPDQPGTGEAMVAETGAFLGSGSRAALLQRIAVPAGSVPGEDRGVGRFHLFADATGASPTWTVDVVVVDDWGQISDPTRVVVTDVARGPPIVAESPIISLPWPFGTELTGSTEPGALVQVGGGRSVVADADGRFRLPVTLVPWPQDLEVMATDASGARRSISVDAMGLLDPRRVPPGAALAVFVLLAVVIALLLEARRSARRPGADPSVPTTGPGRLDPGDAWRRTGPDPADEWFLSGDGPTIEDLAPRDAR